MSYQIIAVLTDDQWFNARIRSCCVEQGETYQNDQRPDFVAVAQQALRGDGVTYLAFARLTAAGPGIADKADNGDGTVNQEQVTDADLLSSVQANWQVVAGLYFDTEGIPK